MKGEELLSFEVTEYIFQPKSVDWFWALGIGAVAIAVAALFFGNILFALLIIIGALAVGLLALRIPKEVLCVITDKGILFDETFYPYGNLQSFAVDENTEPPKLIIVSQKMFMPHIVIPIDQVSPEEIHNILRKYLRKGDHTESLVDIVANRLGF